jgi:2-phosphosulfolactate phosphatase
MPTKIPLDVALLPRELQSDQLRHRAVIVFDVLRASTSIIAALHGGITEIRIFGDTSSARAAALAFNEPRILCGEENCLPPPDFDLGNSPSAFQARQHSGRTAFMSTTNGTRAILAAQGAGAIFIGALVNASAVAQAAAAMKLRITLLCAGTNGKVAMEDLIGAGAVVDALRRFADVQLESDVASLALRLFQGAKSNLESALMESQGGRNVVAAGLEGDVHFAAQLDHFTEVGIASGNPPVVRARV